MRTILTFLFFICSAVGFSQANLYTFSSASNVELENMQDSSQLIAGGSDFGTSTVQFIGFEFNFGNVAYDRFSVNANGALKLGTTVITGAQNNNLNNANTLSPAIFPFWDDLATGTDGEVRSVLKGQTPNQKLVIEWFVSIPKTTSGPSTARFQCILEESTNKIQFIYGTGMVANSSSSGATIGIISGGNTYQTVNSSDNTSFTNSFISNNTTAITAGQSYTFSPPTCFPPTAIAVTNVTANSALIFWSDPIEAPELGYEVVVSTNATQPSVPGSEVSENEIQISNLTANTQYYFYIKSNCGEAVSGWSQVGTFTTLCQESSSIIENFDAIDTENVNSFPDCWSRSGSISSAFIISNAVVPTLTSNALCFNTSTNNVPYTLLPPISNLTAGTHRLRFDALALSANASILVGYFNNTQDSSTFVTLESFTLTEGGENFESFSVIPNQIPDGVNQLVFTTSIGIQTTLFIDNVRWEVNSTCSEPTSLSAENVTDSQATVSWLNPTSTEWKIEFGIANFQLGTGTTISNLNTNSYTFLNLTANTSYHFYVKAICTGGVESSWSGPFLFATTCGILSTFAENFDSLPTGLNETLPTCWGTDNLFPVFTGSLSDSAAPPMSAPNTLIMTGDPSSPEINSYVLMPLLSNLNANTHQLKFKTYANFATTPVIQIGYLTAVNDLSTYQEIAQVNVPLGLANTAEITVTPGSLPISATRLVFKNSSALSQQAEIYIDDVSWELIPACQIPTDLTVTALLDTSAAVSWNEPNEAENTSYQYLLSTSDTAPSSDTIPTGTITENSITLTELTPNTEYFFWVRKVCGAESTSSWSNVLKITTPCLRITPSYTENFEIFIPQCWKKYQSGGIESGPIGEVNTGAWEGNEYLNAGSSGAANINIYSTSPLGTGWLVSPIFDLSAGNYTLSFNVGATQFASTSPIASGPTNTLGTDDFVFLLISNNAGTSWSILETYDANNTPSHLGELAEFNLSETTSSQVQFAFYATSGVSSEGQDIDFFIDNFSIDSNLSVANPESTTAIAYPNPVNDILQINAQQTVTQYSIFTVTGQLIRTENPINKTFEIDMENLAPSFYIIELKMNEKSERLKIIKK